jgi:hypothetical protein
MEISFPEMGDSLEFGSVFLVLCSCSDLAPSHPLWFSYVFRGREVKSIWTAGGIVFFGEVGDQGFIWKSIQAVSRDPPYAREPRPFE